MKPPTIDCARAMRDGGIDAMAALNEALQEALVGLTSKQVEDLKLVFGRVMGDLAENIINPAVYAFPELNPDGATWTAVAKARAVLRGKRM